MLYPQPCSPRSCALKRSVCGIFCVTMGIAIVTILLTLHLLIYFVIKLKVNQKQEL